MPKYKVAVKCGYAPKVFEFRNLQGALELIRCMIIGSDDIELCIKTEYIREEESNDEREIDR